MQLAEHPLSSGKGELVQNRNHLRDYQAGIDALRRVQGTSLCSDPDHFLDVIKREKGRYIRDQYKLILWLHEIHSEDVILRAFEFCVRNRLYSAVSLRDAAEYVTKNEDVIAEPQSRSAHGLPEHLHIKANVRDIHVYSSLAEGGDCR